MAYEIPVLKDTYTFNASTTAKNYYIVKHTTSTRTVALTTAAGEDAYGVVQEPTSSGGSGPVLVCGITKLAHDGSMTPGALFMASSAGLGTAVSTGVGVYRLGRCIEAGSTVSGTIVTALWQPIGPSTN